MHIYCLADAAATSGAAAGPAGLFNSPIVPMVLMVVAFYFLLIRPQQQRAKAQAKLLAALKPGDKVGTSAGLIGVVVTVKDKTVTLRSGDAKLEFTKPSITEIIESGSSVEA